MARLGAIVLCGGQSSRMGSAKAWLDFGGEALLVRVVRRIGEAAGPVVVVAAGGQELPELPAGVEVVRDAVSGRGPLQGIAAGMAAMAGRVEAVFVSSTDAPFVTGALVRRLGEVRGEEYEIAVARVGGRVHPLAGVYAVSVKGEIEGLLAAGRLRVGAVFERVRTLVADEEMLLAGAELRGVDPRLRGLCNVNTPEEYAAAVEESRGALPDSFRRG